MANHKEIPIRISEEYSQTKLINLEPALFNEKNQSETSQRLNVIKTPWFWSHQKLIKVIDSENQEIYTLYLKT